MDLQQLADSIGAISTFSIWFYFRFVLSVAIIGWAAIKVNSWFFSLLWNRGYDPKKHLLALKRIAAVIVVIIMALEVIQAIHDLSPLLAVLLLVAMLTILVFVHKDAIANLTAGIAILVHNKIKIGYRINTHQPSAPSGQVSGVVESIDFLHTIIRLDDGGKALIPHRDVFSQTTVIAMEQPGFAVIAEVDCPREALISTEKIEQMVRSLPYRQSKSPIDVAIIHIGNPRRYQISFYVWSPDVVTIARNSFYEAMASHINQQLKAKASKPGKATLATKVAAKASTKAASKKTASKARPTSTP